MNSTTSHSQIDLRKKYILLEDVQKILIEWDMDAPFVENIKKQVKSLPSINPEETIKEMIEQRVKKHNYDIIDDTETDKLAEWIDTLKELLQKFKS